VGVPRHHRPGEPRREVRQSENLKICALLLKPSSQIRSV
jgi:hypothetical protein